MKKLLIVFLLFLTTAFADELHLAKSFQDAVLTANKEGKPIMFIVSRHTCKYCVILEKHTLSKQDVIEELNKNFVTYIAYTDDGDSFPDALWRPGTPAIWFLYDDASPLSEPVMGAIDETNLLKALDIIKTRFAKVKRVQQYNYTKNKL